MSARRPDRHEGPPRLAILLQDLEFGGTQRFALHLLRGLDRSRLAPELWVLNAGSDLHAEALAAGAPVIRLSQRPPGSPLALAPLARRLVSHRPDILFTLTVVPNIWGRLFGRLAGVPAIVSGYRGLRPKQWESLLWRLSDRIVCNAEALRQRLIQVHGVPPERVAVIPNCVDTERFAPTPGQEKEPAPPRIVTVARLVEDKAPLVLAEVFALVRRQVPGALLTVVGDGPLRGAFEARLAALGLADAVEVVTGCGEVAPHLARAQVFVLASVREGSPNAVLEAMAAGLPVVACRTGGIPELVSHGETGLLAQPGDAAGLAQALAALLTDAALARRMGLDGRARAEAGHGFGAMVRATEAVLLEALAQRRRL
ncbi:MAG TPA: glycosyltransferase [Humidesulfovibrio sp.]|uniref:glycosyltransferase n=1 Tax=Humidesulfovibrio sp. TaxID=2910988 RepID=UPI002D0079A5|nr:glycosyltransferase [Humidesulfovibrio sp.]HWR03510.1 glycosyltransferase [Humidesulfovibrio sp.]